MKQSKNWSFTDFSLLDFEKIYNKKKDIIRYIAFGREIGKKTKRLHNQGWVQFFKKKRREGVKKILESKELHLEPCRGSEYDNEKYCAKDGKFKNFGEFIKQGHRSDLDLIQKKLKADKTIEDIMEEDFNLYCKYRNGIKDYAGLCAKVKSSKFREITVEYIYGKTGTGKTKYAMENAQYKIEGDNLNWWDGYNGENAILIDEYANDVKITNLLNLLDGYQLRLPIKGGFTYAQWTKVYITSNLTPEQLHQGAKQSHRAALFRRINKCVLM